MAPNQKPSAADSSPAKSRRSGGDLLVSVLPDLTLELDRDGHFCAFHGGDDSNLYESPDDFLTRHFSEVLPPQVSVKFEQALDSARAHGQGTTFTYLLPVNNELNYFECRIFQIEGGHFLALIRNMTDTWRTKKALEQSESRYRTLVNNLPGVVYRCLLDDDWTAVFVSENVAELFGYHADDFVNGNLGLNDLIHPEDRARVQEGVIAGVENRRPFHLSYRMVDAEGDVIQVVERGQAIFGHDDEPDYLDGVFFDISEMHRMRQRLLINSKMAAVGNLAAGVAHEINNPLAIAMANLEYVSEELGDVRAAVQDDDTVFDALGDVTMAVGKIQQSIDRVRNIIDDLRTFSDAAEGRADRLDAKRLVDWAIRRRMTNGFQNVDLDVDLQPVSPVWASEVGLVQVIWNLLDNAREALSRRPDDAGPGKITVKLFEEDQRVCLLVADNGPGMPRQVTNRAFEPFFTTKSVGEGAGLGLFVCQGLVDSMEGVIELTSEVGEGTRVQVCLPVHDPSPPLYQNGNGHADDD